jgi:hypothetical protein
MNKLSLFLVLTVNVCIPVLEQVAVGCGWLGCDRWAAFTVLLH